MWNFSKMNFCKLDINSRSCYYLKFFGWFVNFHSTITALLVPFKCLDHADLRGRKKRKWHQIKRGKYYIHTPIPPLADHNGDIGGHPPDFFKIQKTVENVWWVPKDVDS